jgi:hypothetical protein
LRLNLLADDIHFALGCRIDCFGLPASGWSHAEKDGLSFDPQQRAPANPHTITVSMLTP